MYHIKKRALALAAAVLLLAGCGSRGESPLDQSQPPQSAVSTSASAREERPAGTDKSTQSPADGSGDSSGDQAPEDDPQQAQDPDPSQQADPGQPEPQAQQPQEDLFAQLPQTFVFSSGAGAWSTQISIKADGTFTGHYEDADAGDAGDGYDSTVYQCDFSGRFTPPVEPQTPVLTPKEQPKEPSHNRAYDYEAEQSHPSAEEKADALIEEIGQQIEQSLSGSTLGDIAQEDHSGDTRKLDTLHGFPVSKKFEDLQFGRNYDPKKR